MWFFFSLKKKNCSLNEILKKQLLLTNINFLNVRTRCISLSCCTGCSTLSATKQTAFMWEEHFLYYLFFFLTKLFPKNNRNVTNQISYYLQLIFIICVHQIAITILKLVIIFIFLNRSKKLSVLFSLHALPCQAILTSDYFCSLLIKKLSESIN